VFFRDTRIDKTAVDHKDTLTGQIELGDRSVRGNLVRISGVNKTQASYYFYIIIMGYGTQ